MREGTCFLMDRDVLRDAMECLTYAYSPDDDMNKDRVIAQLAEVEEDDDEEEDEDVEQMAELFSKLGQDGDMFGNLVRGMGLGGNEKEEDDLHLKLRILFRRLSDSVQETQDSVQSTQESVQETRILFRRLRILFRRPRILFRAQDSVQRPRILFRRSRFCSANSVKCFLAS